MAKHGNSGPCLNQQRRIKLVLTKASVRTRGLPLALALCVASFTAANKLWSAPVTSPVGSYGILLNQWPSSNTGSDETSALLGVLSFDGAGNVTTTYTKVNVDYSVISGTAGGPPRPTRMAPTQSISPSMTGRSGRWLPRSQTEAPAFNFS